jgi:hypothetical protein
MQFAGAGPDSDPHSLAWNFVVVAFGLPLFSVRFE